MPKGRIARLAVSVALLLSVISIVLLMSGPEAIRVALSERLLPSVALAALFLAGGVALSSLRLKLIAADLGYPLSFRGAAMSLSVGQLAGTVIFQFAGQLIGRSAVLSRHGIFPAATVVISGYERVTALGASLLLAGLGALYLFGTLSLNLDAGGVSLVKLAFGLTAAIVAGALLAWGRTVANVARGVTWEHVSRVLRSFVISLAIQFTTLTAYVVLGRTLAPNIGILPLAAASCIVMLAASLPISLGGWGLRELSAVVALQAIGMSSASALLVAVLIGLLSFAAVAFAAVATLIGAKKNEPSPGAAPADTVPDYTAVLDWSLPLVAATAVFFQVYLPTGSSLLSVNLADPFVVLAAGLFGLRHIGRRWPTWGVPYTNAYVAAATAVIAVSFLRGWASFGWTDWAFANRLLGWLVLLCYGMTGALIVCRAEGRGFELLLKTVAATGAAIALLEVGIVALVRLGIESLREFTAPQISGFSQTSNAFAFVLLLMLACTMVLELRARARIGLMVVAMLGLWFAGSRAALIALPIVLGAGMILGLQVRQVLIVVAAVAASIFIIAMLPVIGQGLGAASAGISVASIFGSASRNNPSGQLQHWQTVQDGLAMFLQHPLLGAGLGAYMNEQIRTTGEPLVIHSTPVWLLAETGIVGFAVFFAAACRLFVFAVRRRGEPQTRLLILMLCALAAMSFVHELMYQRAFWILLGAALAMAAQPLPRASNESLSTG